MTPILGNMSITLTRKLPGEEGHAPISLVFFADNIKVYVNLLAGKIQSGSTASSLGYLYGLKL